MKIIKFTFAVFIVVTLGLSLMSMSAHTEDSLVAQADAALSDAFGTICDANLNGANTSLLMQVFNHLNENLSMAINLARAGDMKTAEELATKCIYSAKSLKESAVVLKEEVSSENQKNANNFLVNMGISVAILIILVFAWFSVRRLTFTKKSVQRFALAVMAFSLIAVIIVSLIGLTSYIVRSSGGFQFFKSQHYSELWILGPNGEAFDYPENVSQRTLQNFNLEVKNNLDLPTYYIVLMKIRDSTQPLPIQNTSTPSPLEPICEFRFAINPGKTWTKQVSLEFPQFTTFADYLQFGSIKVNDVLFRCDCLALWDHGFYFEVFFELWTYDSSAKSIAFTNQYVGLWLNMTKT